MHSIRLTVLSQNPSSPIPQRLEREKRHTSIGFESMQKQSSPPSISVAILSLIVLQREEVILRLSLYCLRDIRLGNSAIRL